MFKFDLAWPMALLVSAITGLMVGFIVAMITADKSAANN